LQKRLGIMDVLPGMIAPRAKMVLFEPTSHCAGRDGGKRGITPHAASHLGSAPTRERHLVLARQTTSDGGHLRAYLRGENALVPHCEARQQAYAS
jgi:hypothetical protein